MPSTTSRVARNHLAGGGFVDLVGPLGSWPPLYPAMLAGGGLFGLDPYAVAGPLNAVIFGLTVLVAGSWLRRHLHSRFLWLWGCFSIALALPLAEVASQSHERVGFHSVRSACADADRRSLERRWTRAALIRAAAFSALACLTRYLGVSVILAVVSILLEARAAPREKMKRIAVYTLIAAAPVGSVDTADLSGCRINDRRKRQGFLLISLPRGRGFAHRCRGRVARRVDRAGPVGARDGRLPCVLPSLGSEKGRSCCFGCCLGSVARIRRFRARLPDAARRHAAVGRRLGWIAVEIPHSIVCSAPVRGAADDGRRPAVCAEAGAAGESFRAGGEFQRSGGGRLLQPS